MKHPNRKPPPKPKNGPPVVPAAPQVLELRIQMTSTGQVQIAGPLDQRHLCYAMLDMAREILITRAVKASEQKIQAPASGLVLPR